MGDVSTSRRFILEALREAGMIRLDGDKGDSCLMHPRASHVSQRALSRASEGEAHGCTFQRRKDARSRHQGSFVKNIGKTEGNRSK